MILVVGPPLPGRFILARALERNLGARRVQLEGPSDLCNVGRAVGAGGLVLVEGELRRRDERRAVLELEREAGARVIVEWQCSPQQAEREARHHYASLAQRLAELELARYEEDRRAREPASEDEGHVVAVRAGAPLDEALAQVRTLVGAQGGPDGVDRRIGVLVVEDDPAQRALEAEVLRELGCDVTVAGDAALALGLLDANLDVDVVVCDYDMPGLTGGALVELLAAAYPRLRTVILTAYPDDPLCERALRLHTPVLEKPLRVMDLKLVLDES